MSNTDLWVEIFVIAPYKQLMKTYGKLPVAASDGQFYPITPQPFAKGVAESLTEVVKGYEESPHKNYDGNKVKLALGKVGLAVGLVEDAHSLVSPDGKADIGLIPPFNRGPASWKGTWNQPSWWILSPDGAMNYWGALKELAQYLDGIGERDWSFWETSAAGIKYVFEPFGDLAVSVLDAAREVPKAVGSVFDFGATVIRIVSSPITWAITGGALILYHLKEEGRKGVKK